MIFVEKIIVKKIIQNKDVNKSCVKSMELLLSNMIVCLRNKMDYAQYANNQKPQNKKVKYEHWQLTIAIVQECEEAFCAKLVTLHCEIGKKVLILSEHLRI